MKTFAQLLLLILIVLNTQIRAEFIYGLDKNEASDLIRLSYYPFIIEKGGDSLMKTELPNYEIVKTVDSVAMDNGWSVIKTEDKGVISFRGTTSKQISWLANFYAAMIPAKGQMTLPSGKVVNYVFADDDRAGIQTGWSLAILIMQTEIIEEIKKLNKEGILIYTLQGIVRVGLYLYYLVHFLNTCQIVY